jgi:hypothetical protein
MKTQKILVSFMAALIAIFAVSTVMAGVLDVDISEVSVNDEDITADTLADVVDSDIEVRVKFEVTDTDDLDDVKVKAWISGYKDEIEASTDRFDAISGRTYIKKLVLELPNVKDIDDLEEDVTLHVEIFDKNDDVEVEYDLTVQRESYGYDLLSVEAPSKASAGDVVAIDVVLKNVGRNELEDSFVTAKIPGLGIAKKVYFGDIAPEDDFDDDDDAEDAKERRIYLVIPADAESGEYDIEVKASNYDVSSEVVESITIEGVNSEGKVIDTSADGEGVPNSVVVLTVVLVIIFVVLLIVLIVLLTKKPEERIEDFGETSYY